MQIRVLLLTMPRSPWNRGKPAIEHLGFSGLAQNLNSISLPHSTFPHSSDQHQHFIKIPNVPCNVHLVQYFHHGNTHGSWSNPSNRKKYSSFLLMPNFRKLQEDSKNVSLKIGSWKPQKLGPFSHFSSWEKRLSSGQKCFLRPYFPLIRGMFLLRSGLRFSFRALEVPEPRVRNKSFSLREPVKNVLADFAR